MTLSYFLNHTTYFYINDFDTLVSGQSSLLDDISPDNH